MFHGITFYFEIPNLLILAHVDTFKDSLEFFHLYQQVCHVGHVGQIMYAMSSAVNE